MKVSEYIVDFLISKGVTDVFGLPGEVVLDLLDALNNRQNEISVHLNYHEQAAAFAACGYAQSSGKLGVAYSTKGPGLTNMITPITDAFCDSTPVLFITAHSHTNKSNMRFEYNQEFDTIHMLSNVVKYATKITDLKDVCCELERSYCEATSGRKGPVFIDINSDILKSHIDIKSSKSYKQEKCNFDSYDKVVECLKTSLASAHRPILLIGDGINQSNTQKYLKDFAKNLKIPVLSSRFSQDIMPDSKYYYGFVGSHGTRYGNFILSKCDLLISLGNRLSYNANSNSFSAFVKHAKSVRIDIDTNEFSRDLPNTINLCADLKELMPLLAKENWDDMIDEKWLDICDILKKTLFDCDMQYPVNIISNILKCATLGQVITSDVGNNEFWLSRAYAFALTPNRILFSKSFGALGCSLPKAIGAYHATHKKVLCFTGDQGLQINIQELQYISHTKIPIAIIIINNFSSGMICSKQKSDFGSRFVHTTLNSGYFAPDIKSIAKAFSIQYCSIKNENDTGYLKLLDDKNPCIIEIMIDENIDISPKLSKNRLCQDFEPLLERNIFDYLDKL
jgi:acetolactate synthase-1/2/3 large subunit